MTPSPSSAVPAPKAFYQKAPSPVVIIPDQLIHHDVVRQHQPPTGEPKPPFYIVELPAHSLCMTVGSLLPGQTTGKHRHSYETVMFITQGQGYTL